MMAVTYGRELQGNFIEEIPESVFNPLPAMLGSLLVMTPAQ